MDATIKAADRPRNYFTHKFGLLPSILITVGCFLILIAVGAFIFVTKAQREAYLSDPSISLGIRANHNARLFERQITLLEQDLRFLAKTRSLLTEDIEFSDEDAQVWKDDIARMFIEFAATHPDYQQMRYIGLKNRGMELVRVNVSDGKAIRVPEDQLQHKGTKEYFVEATKLAPGQIYLSEINLNEEFGEIEYPNRPTLRAITPVFAPKGTMFGLMVINLDLTRALNALAEDLPTGFYSYVMNSRGEFLHHPDSHKTFGFLKGTLFGWQNEMPSLILPEQVLTEKTPDVQSVETENGLLHIAVSKLNLNPDAPIYFAYGMPEEYVDHYLSETILTSIATIALLTLISFLAVFYFVFRMFKPIEQLTNVARNIGAGNYDVEFPEPVDNKMKTYLDTFRTMIDNIKLREDEIGAHLMDIQRNELHLKTTLHNLAEGVLTIDMTGEVLHFNGSAVRMYELEETDDVRAFITSFAEKFQFVDLSGEVLDTSRWPERRVAAGETIRDLELRVENIETGWYRIFSYNGSAVIENGVPEFTIITFRDITTQRELDVENQRAEAQFRFLAGRIGGYAFIGLDPEGKIGTWNMGAERLFGYTEDEVIGASLDKFHQPLDIRTHLTEEIINQARTNGQSDHVGWRLRKDKSSFYADSSVTALRDDHGVLIGFIKVIRDVTDRRQKELALRAAEVADSANAAKSEFLASMSHELRTPLNAIIGYSELLIDDVSDNSVKSDLSKIRGAGNHLLALINDILDLSKIEAGKLELSMEQVDVPGLIGEIADTITPLIEKNGNTLTTEYDENIGWITSDPIKLKQVIYNFLSNAAKFTHKGEINLTVRRQTDTNLPAGIQIEVQDTGIGMSEEQLKKLFEPFMQVSTNTYRNVEGTGLGLVISKRLIAMFGGTISVCSTVNEGTTFTVNLPDNLAAKQQAD